MSESSTDTTAAREDGSVRRLAKSNTIGATVRAYQRCTNCVMGTTDSRITFDERGVCDPSRSYYEHVVPVPNKSYLDYRSQLNTFRWDTKALTLLGMERATER